MVLGDVCEDRFSAENGFVKLSLAHRLIRNPGRVPDRRSGLFIGRKYDNRESRQESPRGSVGDFSRRGRPRCGWQCDRECRAGARSVTVHRDLALMRFDKGFGDR